jgi:hypothetical protein
MGLSSVMNGHMGAKRESLYVSHNEGAYGIIILKHEF